jgi:hypothetical protein
MKTKTAIEQKAKIVNRLDEVQRAINHWTDKKNQANYYLEERLNGLCHIILLDSGFVRNLGDYFCFCHCDFNLEITK